MQVEFNKYISCVNNKKYFLEKIFIQKIIH